MPAKQTTLVTGGLFAPEVMSKKLRRNLDNDSVWADCVNHDYEGEIRTGGDTVIINQPGNINVGTYVKGTPMQSQSPDGANMTLVVDQQKYFNFEIEEIDKVQANIALVDKYFDRAKSAITLDKDTYLGGIAWAQMNAAHKKPSTALSASNIYNYFIALRATLRKANAIKQNGRGYDNKLPFAIVTPEIMSVILQAPENLRSTNLGDETTRYGTVLKFAGFDVKETTNGVADELRIVAGTTEALTLADQITRVRTVEDKDDFAAHCAGLYVYGAKVVQDKCLTGGVVTLA